MCLKKKMLLSHIFLLLPGRSVGWLVGRSVGRSVGRLVGSLVGRVVGWFVGVLVVCLGCESMFKSSVWLLSVACFVSWLAVDGLVGWLVGRCLRWFVRSVVRSGLGCCSSSVRWLVTLLLCWFVGSCRPPGCCCCVVRWHAGTRRWLVLAPPVRDGTRVLAWSLGRVLPYRFMAC